MGNIAVTNPEPTTETGPKPIAAGADVTGGAGSNSQAISTDATSVRFCVTGANVRIKFGDSSVSVTSTTGILFLSGVTDLIRCPPGTTHFAYIGNGATINFVEMG